MTKTLEEILQTYFGCSVPFRKDGELTTTGEKAMRKLEGLLADLEGIGAIPSASQAVRVLDEITHDGEEPDEDPALKEALDYVCKELGTERTVAVRMTVTHNMKHRLPAATGIDDGKVIDLLEEYGEDNGLAEGWWEEYGDIDDILMRI